MNENNNVKNGRYLNKTSFLTKLIAAIILVSFIIGCKILVERSCNEYNAYKEAEAERLREEKIIQDHELINLEAKKIIEQNGDFELGDEKVTAYICSGENKNEVILISCFYYYSPVMTIHKLLFNEEIEGGYLNIADAIKNKTYYAVEIYNEPRYFTSEGEEFVAKLAESQTTKLNQYIDDGYEYKVYFIGIHNHKSVVTKENTFNYRIFLSLKKNEELYFFEIALSATSIFSSSMYKPEELTLTEFEMIEYSNDIFESIDIVNKYNEKYKNK